MSTEMRALDRIPPWSMAVAAMLLIQFTNAFSVFVIDDVGPAGTALLRMACGTVFLWAIARPSLRTIRSRDVPILILLGVATGMMTTLFLFAVERIPLGTAVAIEFLGPLTVAGLTSRNKRTLVWPGLALVGVVLLTEPWMGTIDFLGVAFALAAGVCWGLYTVFTQSVGDRFSGISGLSLTIPVATIAILPIGLPQVIGGDFSWTVLLIVAGIALITPVASFGLEMLALRKMNHAAFGTLLSIEPAFGVLIGLLVLAQSPAVPQIAGIVLVVIAGAAAQRYGHREITVVAADVEAAGESAGRDADPAPVRSQERSTGREDYGYPQGD
ncbi:EamA family transporter [Brevibacterium sp. FAM 24638]|uniref:EamA family transporter n=1 Tax=Brevibacterium sp. FAM 24638 TaxID=3415681 RepID=UPI003C79807C